MHSGRPVLPGARGRAAERSATPSSSPVQHLVSSIRHSKSMSTSRAVLSPTGGELQRVLYSAKAGNALAVLCCAGKAVRLTYDRQTAITQEKNNKQTHQLGGIVYLSFALGTKL
ncbi:hypothetical protein AURDEDRAFT_178445 [Auricularia subglabra TFB-10046 SS5]|uniref:Uncharacterized protein n=1 Tax=Auricularia subglabra (strain TFB-10046 / SS5) TaxID=717982 RepID=J0WL51_AURST|nr:hypothetical protein AURDEDRAFT_178445 [Auricularia subglabra TFB-10046 SS5]